MLSLLLAASAATPTLDLICTGQALASVPVETASVAAVDSYGGTAYGSGVRREVAPLEASVGFRLADGKALIHIPAWLANDINKGDAGWFKVKGLVISETVIAGKAAIGFLNRPSFRIDRMTGEMTTSGGNRFICRPREHSEKKF